MAQIERNKVDELSVMGFDGKTAEEIADQIQEKLINPFVGKNTVKIAERLFWQPATAEANYGAVIFYIVGELPPEPKADDDETPEEDKHLDQGA